MSNSPWIKIEVGKDSEHGLFGGLGGGVLGGLVLAGLVGGKRSRIVMRSGCQLC